MLPTATDSTSLSIKLLMLQIESALRLLQKMLFKNTHCQSATSNCKTEFYQPLCMSKCWSASSRLPVFLTWPVPQTEWFQTEHKRMPLFQENDLGWISEFSVLHSYLKENQTSTISIPPCLILFGSSSPHKYLFSPSLFPSPSLFLFSL